MALAFANILELKYKGERLTIGNKNWGWAITRSGCLLEFIYIAYTLLIYRYDKFHLDKRPRDRQFCRATVVFFGMVAHARSSFTIKVHPC